MSPEVPTLRAPTVRPFLVTRARIPHSVGTRIQLRSSAGWPVAAASRMRSCWEMKRSAWSARMPASICMTRASGGGLGAGGEGALDELLRPVVLRGGLRQVFGNGYLAAGADALLLGDERLGRLSGGSGQRYLLLDAVGRAARREGAAHQVQGDALLVRDSGQVLRDFGPI